MARAMASRYSPKYRMRKSSCHIFPRSSSVAFGTNVLYCAVRFSRSCSARENVELHPALCSCNIGRVVCIERLVVVSVQNNRDLRPVRVIKLLHIHFHGCGMCKNNAVCNSEWLRARIIAVLRAVTRCKDTTVETIDGDDVGLVERNPLLYTVTKMAEAESSIVTKGRNNSRPANREAIAVDSVRLQKGNIFLHPIVMIACHITALVVGSSWLEVRELVPDVAAPHTNVAGSFRSPTSSW
ncbi:hypothetical protein KCU67_g42, partial [Aureobasidium melanogenum]